MDHTKSMKHIFSTAVAILALSQIQACSWLTDDEGYFRDRSTDYRHTEIEPDLKIPEGAQTPNYAPFLVIPESNEQLDPLASNEVPMPPQDLAQDEQLIRVQRLDQREWLIANVSAGQVWPRVMDFLRLNQIPMAQGDGASGAMASRWLVSSADESVRERFRFEILQGVQRNTSEVHVLQQQASRDAAVPTEWPTGVSANAEREAWMIEQLSRFLANASTRPSVSLLAYGISEQSLLEFQKGKDVEPALLLQLSSRRAWASVELALKKSNFELIEADKETGILQVRWLPTPRPEDQPGFWARLFGADDAEYAELPYAGEPIELRFTYQAGKARITVTDDAKYSDNLSARAESILAKFKPFLS